MFSFILVLLETATVYHYIEQKKDPSRVFFLPEIY